MNSYYTYPSTSGPSSTVTMAASMDPAVPRMMQQQQHQPQQWDSRPAQAQRPAPTQQQQQQQSSGTTQQTTVGGIPVGLQGLTPVADKSCARCRIRKVKCDRRFPLCSRCDKRGEPCEYKDDVSLAIQLQSTSAAALKSPAPAPRDIPLSAGQDHRPMTTSAPLYSPYSRPAPNPPPHPPSSLSRPLYPSYPLPVHGRPSAPKDEEDSQDLKSLWDKFLRSNANIGEGSVDWQLAKPTMAESLTLHLLEASTHSCCFHLPAFHIFAPRIEHIKKHLTKLPVQDQVIVAILASLGARASPHSALLGVAGPDLNISKTKAPQEFLLSGGVRRENAWRALADRAVGLSSQMTVLQTASKKNLEVLVALIQMLMLSKVKPIKSRFFLRNATGMFIDLQRDPEVSLGEVLAIKRSVGATLYECDARVAAYSSAPLCLSDQDIEDYFEGTGVVVPDLATDDLGQMLESIFEAEGDAISRQKIDDAIALTNYFICALQRTYSKIATTRRGTVDLSTTLPRFWSWVDSAHAAVQRLYRRLMTLQQGNVEVPGSDHDVEYDLLIAVRMDNRLIDLLNLAHEFLREQLAHEDDLVDDEADKKKLEEMFAMSERRVRKCLKLLAFYSKVFVDSRDKHLVYHLFVQLQALPSWALIAPQKAGELTSAGPLPKECELTEEELDWLTAALELACFFTPLAAARLQELKQGRQSRNSPSFDVFQYSYPPEPVLPSIPVDSHGSSPDSNDSFPTASPPTEQPAFIQEIPSPPLAHARVPSATHLSGPLPTPTIFPPTPKPTNQLSPYTFDTYGTPSLGGPSSSSHHGHSHHQAYNQSNRQHSMQQDQWLPAMDYDAILQGAGGRSPNLGYPQQARYQQPQQYHMQPQHYAQQQQHHQQQQQQQQQQWGNADLSQPFDEQGRWGVGTSQW